MSGYKRINVNKSTITSDQKNFHLIYQEQETPEEEGVTSQQLYFEKNAKYYCLFLFL